MIQLSICSKLKILEKTYYLFFILYSIYRYITHLKDIYPVEGLGRPVTVSTDFDTITIN